MEDKEFGGNTDWMSSLPEELLDVPLWYLAIPGSHDSMSFCLDVSSPVLRSQPCLLRVIDRLLPCWTRPCVSRWATTQQSVLSDQCDLGIRFLDLRIARKPAGGNKLFFAHGIYTLMTVKEALDELATWLDAHPKEIVIISCSHFESLTDEDHVHLVEFILRLFGKKLCSSQNMRKMTMRALSLLLRWASEQRPGCEVGGVNILCCDFVGVSQFCSLVIGLNYKLLGGASTLTAAAARPVCRWTTGAPSSDVIGCCHSNRTADPT